MKTKNISVTDAVKMISESNGKFMTVKFTKRTDNSLRKMNCRIGVKKGVKGVRKARKNTGLMTVYDMVKKEFRNINISGLREISANGTRYIVR